MTIDDLLALARDRGHRPALVWYSSGERIELSGKVLANHIVKAANYLTSIGVAEDSSVCIDLPDHWKALVWTLATAGCGARICTPHNAADLGWNDVWLTAHPAGVETAATVAAVAMGSLSFGWDGPLPDDVDDAAAGALGQPDAPLQQLRGQWLSEPVTLPGVKGAALTTRPHLADSMLSECLRADIALVVVTDPRADISRIASAERATIIDL